MTVIASVDYPLTERDVEVVERALHVAADRSDADVTVLHVDTGGGRTTESDVREDVAFSFPEFRGEVVVRRASDVPGTIEETAQARDAEVVVIGEPSYAEKLESAVLGSPKSVAETVSEDGSDEGIPFEVTLV